jgi:hypothetical protein
VNTPARVLVAWALLGLAGCATTRTQAPPEVIPRPGPTQRYRPTEMTVEEIRKRDAAVTPPLDFQQRLDQAHDHVYTWTQGLVEATDHKFADKEKELRPIPAAPFRLGMELESIDRSDGMDMDFDLDLDIALSLPNIEERLRIFVTSDELDEAPRVAGEDRDVRVGLRYRAFRALDFDIGVKLDVPPVAFASVRWTRQYDLGNWDFYPFAKLFADTKESVGYAAAATFDRWAGRNLVRSSTYAKWRNDRDEIQWSQTFIYARVNETIAPDRYGSYLKANDIGRGWGVRLLANGENAGGVSYYEANLFFRRPTPSRWLFWYVEPLVRWDRGYDWKADPGVRMGINILFWDLARPAR